MAGNGISRFTGEVITVDDSLYGEDLTVERAVEKLPKAIRADYKNTYKWFEERSETIGSRHYGHGQRLPDVTIPHAAQRGIHKPSVSDYALTITSSGNKFYDKDEDLIKLSDGTWLFVYSAQVNNKGDRKTEPYYNEALIRCLTDGIPVGVFLKRANNKYFRALAYVEKYDPSNNTFTLHGPVVRSNEASFASPARQINPSLFKETMDYVTDMNRDDRAYERIRMIRRKGQGKFRDDLFAAYEGQCAMSGCDVPETLQAAHIFPYRGTHTNIVENGLLLRADLHLLYDSQLLSVDPSDHKIYVSERIAYPEYLELNGQRIHESRIGDSDRRDDYLAVHHKEFLTREVMLAS